MRKVEQERSVDVNQIKKEVKLSIKTENMGPNVKFVKFEDDWDTVENQEDQFQTTRQRVNQKNQQIQSLKNYKLKNDLAKIRETRYDWTSPSKIFD